MRVNWQPVVASAVGYFEFDYNVNRYGRDATFNVRKNYKYNNLILLCEICHHWVHSKNNTNKEFLR